MTTHRFGPDVSHRALKNHDDFIASTTPGVVYGTDKTVVAVGAAVGAVHVKLGEGESRTERPQHVGTLVVSASAIHSGTPVRVQPECSNERPCVLGYRCTIHSSS